MEFCWEFFARQNDQGGEGVGADFYDGNPLFPFPGNHSGGRARGFAFIEMDDADATKAMEALDGTDFGGRALKVNEARQREERQPRRSWQ